MSEANIQLVNAYYDAMGKKDIDAVSQCLHPKAYFKGPLAELSGKEAVLDGAKKFFQAIESFTMRETIATGNQVVKIYHLNCPDPIGQIRVAALLKVDEGLISHIELFFDARPFFA